MPQNRDGLIRYGDGTNYQKAYVHGLFDEDTGNEITPDKIGVLSGFTLSQGNIVDAVNRLNDKVAFKKSTVFYVDSSSSKGGDGSPENPFNDINDALKEVQGGKYTIFLKGGKTYTVDNIYNLYNTNLTILMWGNFPSTYGDDKSFYSFFNPEYEVLMPLMKFSTKDTYFGDLNDTLEETFGFALFNSTITFIRVKIETSTYSKLGLNNVKLRSVWRGVIRRADNSAGTANFYDCIVDIKDSDLIRITTGTQHINMSFYFTIIRTKLKLSEFSSPETKPFHLPYLISCEEGNIILTFVGMKITDSDGAQVPLKEIIKGIKRYSNNIPMNVLSNVDLS